MRHENYLSRTYQHVRQRIAVIETKPTGTGSLGQVIQEDGSAGMTQIRAAGMTSDLWTYNKFLSRLPIKDAYAEIETPETLGSG